MRPPTTTPPHRPTTRLHGPGARVEDGPYGSVARGGVSGWKAVPEPVAQRPLPPRSRSRSGRRGGQRGCAADEANGAPYEGGGRRGGGREMRVTAPLASHPLTSTHTQPHTHTHADVPGRAGAPVTAWHSSAAPKSPPPSLPACRAPPACPCPCAAASAAGAAAGGEGRRTGPVSVRVRAEALKLRVRRRPRKATPLQQRRGGACTRREWGCGCGRARLTAA